MGMISARSPGKRPAQRGVVLVQFLADDVATDGDAIGLREARGPAEGYNP